MSSAPHLPVKEEKDGTLRESPLPPRGPLYNRNATDSHSSHGSDDGRAEEYNRKMLGFEKRDLGGGQPTIPNMKSNVKKKKEEKEESDHEKSDAELVVDDTTENVSNVGLWGGIDTQGSIH